MTIILTDDKKVQLLQKIFPAWEVMGGLEKSYMSRALDVNDLPSAQTAKLLQYGPGAKMEDALLKYIKPKKELRSVIVVSDPDIVYEPHILAIHQFVDRYGINLGHLPAYCLETRWLLEEVGDIASRTNRREKTPIMYAKAEAQTYNMQANFIAGEWIKTHYAETQEKDAHKRLEAYKEILTRAGLLTLEIIREAQYSGQETYFQSWLLPPGVEYKNPKHIAYRYDLCRAHAGMIKDNDPQIINAYRADRDRWADQSKGNMIENNYILRPEEDRKVKIENRENMLVIQRKLEISPNFKVVCVVNEEDDIARLNPLSFRLLAQESMHAKSGLSELPILIKELFWLYNEGLITWPKSNGYHTPPHLYQLFVDSMPQCPFLEEGRVPSNADEIYDNSYEWAVCPTSPELHSRELIIAQLTNKERSQIPPETNVNSLLALYTFIRSRFVYSIIGEKWTDKKVIYLVGPVNKDGTIKDEKNTYFFRKVGNSTDNGIKVGHILSLKAYFFETTSDPVDISLNSVCYLLTRTGLLQPTTVKKKLEALKAQGALTTFGAVERKQHEMQFRSDQVWEENHKKEEAARLARVEACQKTGKKPEAKDLRPSPKKLRPILPPHHPALAISYHTPPPPDTYTLTAPWEYVMGWFERTIPSLLFPKEVIKLHQTIHRIANGTASADEVYRRWLNEMKQEKTQPMSEMRKKNRKEKRKINA